MDRSFRIYRNGEWFPVAFSDLKVGDTIRHYEPAGAPIPVMGGDGYSVKIIGHKPPHGLEVEPVVAGQEGPTA